MVKPKSKSKKSNRVDRPSSARSEKPKLPAGVIAFGVIHIIIYSLSIIGNIINLVGISALQRTAEIMAISYEYLLISAIVGVIIAGFALAGGIMILTLKELGRRFMVNVAIIVIVLGVLSTAYFASTADLSTELGIITLVSSIIGLLIGCAYQGTVIWYFKRTPIKKIFS